MLYTVQILTLVGWGAVMVIMSPAFLRSLRHRGSIVDVFRSLMWFTGASRIALMTAGVLYVSPPATQDELLVRAGAASLSLICALATLLVAYAYRNA